MKEMRQSVGKNKSRRLERVRHSSMPHSAHKYNRKFVARNDIIQTSTREDSRAACLSRWQLCAIYDVLPRYSGHLKRKYVDAHDALRHMKFTDAPRREQFERLDKDVVETRRFIETFDGAYTGDASSSVTKYNTWQTTSDGRYCVFWGAVVKSRARSISDANNNNDDEDDVMLVVEDARRGSDNVKRDDMFVLKLSCFLKHRSPHLVIENYRFSSTNGTAEEIRTVLLQYRDYVPSTYYAAEYRRAAEPDDNGSSPLPPDDNTLAAHVAAVVAAPHIAVKGATAEEHRAPPINQLDLMRGTDTKLTWHWPTQTVAAKVPSVVTGAMDESITYMAQTFPELVMTIVPLLTERAGDRLTLNNKSVTDNYDPFDASSTSTMCDALFSDGDACIIATRFTDELTSASDNQRPAWIVVAYAQPRLANTWSDKSTMKQTQCCGGLPLLRFVSLAWHADEERWRELKKCHRLASKREYLGTRNWTTAQLVRRFGDSQHVALMPRVVKPGDGDDVVDVYHNHLPVMQRWLDAHLHKLGATVRPFIDRICAPCLTANILALDIAGHFQSQLNANYSALGWDRPYNNRAGKLTIAKGYMAIGSAEAFERHLTSIAPELWNFYEIIRGPCRLYVDLEFSHALNAELTEDGALMARAVFEAIDSACQSELGFGVPPAEWMVTTASNASKTSLHAVHPRVVCDDNQTVMYALMHKVVVPYVDKHHSDALAVMDHDKKRGAVKKSFIDKAVYTSRRNFRFLWQRKYNNEQSRVLIPIRGAGATSTSSINIDFAMMWRQFLSAAAVLDDYAAAASASGGGEITRISIKDLGPYMKRTLVKKQHSTGHDNNNNNNNKGDSGARGARGYTKKAEAEKEAAAAADWRDDVKKKQTEEDRKWLSRTINVHYPCHMDVFSMKHAMMAALPS